MEQNTTEVITKERRADIGKVAIFFQFPFKLSHYHNFLSGTLLSKSHQLFKSAEQYIYSSSTHPCFEKGGGSPVSFIITVTIHVAMSLGQGKTLIDLLILKNKIFQGH